MEEKNEERHEPVVEVDESNVRWIGKPVELETIEDPAYLTVAVNLTKKTRTLFCSKCEETLPYDKISFTFNMCPFCGSGFKNGGKTGGGDA